MINFILTMKTLYKTFLSHVLRTCIPFQYEESLCNCRDTHYKDKTAMRLSAQWVFQHWKDCLYVEKPPVSTDHPQKANTFLPQFTKDFHCRQSHLKNNKTMWYYFTYSITMSTNSTVLKWNLLKLLWIYECYQPWWCWIYSGKHESILIYIYIYICVCVCVHFLTHWDDENS